jgi:hypothetical protein
MDLTPFLDMPDPETSDNILERDEFAILLNGEGDILEVEEEIDTSELDWELEEAYDSVQCKALTERDECFSEGDLEKYAAHILAVYDSLDDEYVSLPEDHPIYPLLIVMCPFLLGELVKGDYDESLKARFLEEAPHMQYHLFEDIGEKEQRCYKCMHQKLIGNFVKQDEINHVEGKTVKQGISIMKLRKWKLVKDLVKFVAIIVVTVALASVFDHVYNVPHQAPIVKAPSIVDRIQETLPSVVHLSVEREDGRIGQGSGFAIAPDLIQTARHVAEKGVKFTISTYTGKVLEATRVVISKEHDVAWIKLEKAPRWDTTGEFVLKPVRFGVMRNMRLGDKVYSIGSTFGKDHMNAVAVGNLQTVNLNGHALNGVDTSYGWGHLFTNTAEGGGGNSGCPLFNEHGQVIGIWVGSRQPSIHMCIPAELFLKELKVIYAMFYLDKYQVVNPLERPEGNMTMY